MSEDPTERKEGLKKVFENSHHYQMPVRNITSAAYQRDKVKVLKVTLVIHGRRCPLDKQLLLQLHQLVKLGILGEALFNRRVSDKVLRPLPCVDKMLTVIIVRVL